MINVYTPKIPSYFTWPMFRRKAKERYYTIGVGRHSNEEIEEWMKHDLRMLSEILGNYC